MNEASVDKVRKVFVIMPFSATSTMHTEEYWTSHFSEYLKPLIEEVDGLRAERSAPLRSDIIKQIINDLVTSPIVVANLTHSNANVLWEMGVRQSFKNGTVTIAEVGTILPFDLKPKGTLFYYPSDSVKDAAFRRSFKAALQHCVSDPDTTDSPVLEAITGRSSLYQVLRAEESARRLEALTSECNQVRINFQHALDTIEENKKSEEAASIATDYARHACLELLITNRYLDSDEAFYELAEEVYQDCLWFNGQMHAWENDAESTEDYLAGLIPDKIQNIDELLKHVQAARAARHVSL